MIVLLILICPHIPSVFAADNEDTQVLVEITDRQDVDSIVATMGDEQVRRLLINELKKQAGQEKSPTGTEGKASGIAGSIENIKDLMMQFRTSIDRLRTSDGIDVEEELPGVYKFLLSGKRGANPATTIMSVVLVFLIGLLIMWIFGKYVFQARLQIESATVPTWTERLTGLALRGFIDIISLIIFIAGVLIASFIFLELNAAQKVLIASYLAAFSIVIFANLVLRFILSPGVPSFRLVPLPDELTVYLYRWFMSIIVISSFGMFTSGVFRLAGLSEINYYFMLTALSFIVAIMLFVMIFQNKHKVAAALSAGKPENSIQARLAKNWHHIAVFAVVLLVLFSMVQRLFVEMSSFAAAKTLVIIGLYFLFDWLLRVILNVAFGLAKQPEDLGTIMEKAKTGEFAEISEADQQDTGKDAEARPKTMVIGRMKSAVRIGLRIALLVYMVFWAARIWGFQFEVGAAISNALFSILITVLVCYIIWELINAKIQQKLKEEMPDADQEMEEGGAGGSRVGTLLLLLQKFFLVVIAVMVVLVVLSSLGVDIGPLIAGAGIVGLAIGMGAQTLVRDIIAGIFFLIDDAFRVGDYIEVSGTKGTVEKISIRSFKLRHPRGMVNTIPFGDISTVTNYSRDYILTKLDFRVRYDTDVEKVRKIIKKKVYKVIAASEELGPKLLDPIKSQGVRQLDDSAMIMRIKFKTAPGDQFGIRKEVFRLLQEAFREEGIEFAHRNVTVYMPNETSGDTTDESASAQEKIKQAAAAAALAAAQEETPDAQKP